jgi:hypothetical protein
MRALEEMLSEQLEFVFRLLGLKVFGRAVTGVKKEISEPLAVRRELVQRFGVDDNFYRTLKRADRIVKSIRG